MVTNKPALPQLTFYEIGDCDENELSEINETYNLGLDLDACNTTSRKRSAVLAALQAAGMLEEWSIKP